MSTIEKSTVVRRRSVETAGLKSKVTPEMKRLAVVFHTENQKALAFKKTADKARSDLYKSMKEAGVASFSADATTEKGSLSLQAELKTPSSKVIDVAALEKLVTREQFIKIVSASQKSVVDVAGTEVSVRCSVEVSGTENVVIAPAK